MYGDRVYAAKSVYEFYLVELHIEGLSGVRPLSPRFRSMKQARTVAALLNEAYDAGRGAEMLQQTRQALAGQEARS